MSVRRFGLAIVATSIILSGGCSSPSPPPPRAAQPHPSDPAATAARISGDWQFAMERGGQSIEGWLHFSLSAGELVGSLTGSDNNPREVSKIVLNGDKISWQIESDYGKEIYEGTLAGSSMNGTLKVSRKSGQGRGSGEGGGSAPAGGGYGGHHGGGRGGGGGGGRGGAAGQVKWHALRSVKPTLPELPEPPEPTKTSQQG